MQHLNVYQHSYGGTPSLNYLTDFDAEKQLTSPLHSNQDLIKRLEHTNKLSHQKFNNETTKTNGVNNNNKHENDNSFLPKYFTFLSYFMGNT